MRIISGTYGSRTINTPKGFKTHPMGERVRSALFNTLGDLNGKTVLDAFAGSGSLAIESISRGATSAIALEPDRSAFVVLQENIESLNIDSIKAIKATASAWSSTNVDKKFDIILCDPPYNKLQLSTVFALTRHLNPNGLMVLSYPGREATPNADGVVVVDNRNYGDAALAYYRVR